jgi:type VI secretion system secreted protein VgrG
MESRGARAAVRAEFRVEGVAPGYVLRAAVGEELSGATLAEVTVVGNPLADGGPEHLLGRSADLLIWREGEEASGRRFYGVVREVEQRWDASRNRRNAVFRMEPAFASFADDYLTQPFVRMSCIEILRSVLVERLKMLGGREVEFRLSSDLRGPLDADHCDDGFLRRDLCVQYGESTYDFCRRVMAEEGLAHFYDHGGAVEKLVIVDGGPFARVGGTIEVKPQMGMDPDAESVFRLSRSIVRAAGRVVLRSFDYLDPIAHRGESPRRGADTEQDQPAEGDVAETYDPHATVAVADGEDVPMLSDLDARRVIAVERARLDRELMQGCGNLLGLAPGQVCEFGSWDDDREVVITRVWHLAEIPDQEASSDGRRSSYENTFECVPARFRFRPPAIPKPVAIEDWGIVVSRNDGDSIDADRHGRVRVRLLHDRRAGVSPDSRSPPIPVSQAWVGDGYGTQILPRAGMLARVEYVFGDPDRPVITECFPTGQNMLPAHLPDQKSRLTIRTQSLREGAQDTAHWNEIALDDAAEAEEVFIRAGRDVRRKVLQDEQTAVEHDESRLVGGDQGLDVLGARTKIIGAGESENVVASRRVTVAGDDERTIAACSDGSGGNDLVDVDGPAEDALRAKREVVVHGSESVVLRAGRTTQVKGDASLQVSVKGATIADGELHARNGKSALTLADSNAVAAPDRRAVLSNDGGSVEMDPDATATVEVSELTLVCGSARMSIGSGKVTFKAPTVILRGAKGRVTLDPGGATTVGADVKSSAVVLNELKGLPVVFSDTPGTAPALVPNEVEVVTAGGSESRLSIAGDDQQLIDFQVTVFQPDFSVAKNVDYRLMTPTGQIMSGTTDATGQLKAKLPAGTPRVDAVFLPPERDGDPFKMELAVHPDPDTPEALIDHVRHAGFGDRTAPAAQALTAFQSAMGLPVTGELDDATRAAIRDLTSGKQPHSNREAP